MFRGDSDGGRNRSLVIQSLLMSTVEVILFFIFFFYLPVAM